MSQNIKKAIAYAAATATFIALVDLFEVALARAWNYDRFKDNHYTMDALHFQRHKIPTTEREVKENNEIDKKLAQVQKGHKELQQPIHSFFFGKFSNKCPICKERE